MPEHLHIHQYPAFLLTDNTEDLPAEHGLWSPRELQVYSRILWLVTGVALNSVQSGNILHPRPVLKPADIAEASENIGL